MQKDIENTPALPTLALPLTPVQVEKIVADNALLDEKNQLLSHENKLLKDQNNLLHQHLQQLTNKISCLEIAAQETQQKIQWFEEQLKAARQYRFGKQSETLHSMQVEIIFDADENLAITATPEDKAEEENAATDTITYTRGKGKVGRRIDFSTLPTVRKIHDLTEVEKICSQCDNPLNKIDDDITRQLEEIPRQLYVVEHVVPKYACAQCNTIQSAQKEEIAPVPKCLAGASLLTSVIISKYEMHLPLYRQTKIFASQGIDIPDNTLGNWVMNAAESLEPFQPAFQAEIQRVSYVQADETPVKVLDPEKKGYMWCFLSPLESDRFIHYPFDLTRQSAVVDTELKEFKGLLQSDGYGGYEHQHDRKDIVCFGCLAHARRKFTDVIKSNPQKTGKAHEGLKYIGLLYQIERNAKALKLDFTERRKLREKEAVPIVEKMQGWLLRSKEQVPPQSGIGQAINYALNQWPHLIRYIHYGAVEIDNNWVENQIRPFALGRRNWLFTKNEASGQKAALLYSLIQSAKLNDMNPRIYLHYVLTQVHALRRKEINAVELLPHRIDRQRLMNFAFKETEKTKLLFATFNKSPPAN